MSGNNAGARLTASSNSFDQVLLRRSSASVLDAIVMTYEFMVAGLFIPTLGAFVWRRGSTLGAIMGMLGGGFTMIADDLARTLLAGEIPLGILTSAIGAGLFIYLMISMSIKVRRDG